MIQVIREGDNTFILIRNAHLSHSHISEENTSRKVIKCTKWESRIGIWKTNNNKQTYIEENDVR